MFSFAWDFIPSPPPALGVPHAAVSQSRACCRLRYLSALPRPRDPVTLLPAPRCHLYDEAGEGTTGGKPGSGSGPRTWPPLPRGLHVSAHPKTPRGAPDHTPFSATRSCHLLRSALPLRVPGELQWAFISSRMGYGSCRDVNRRAVKAESHPECVPLSALLLGEPDPASRTQTRLPVKPEFQTTRESLFGTRIAHAILIQKYIYIFVVYPKFVFCWASCILSLWKGKDTEVL